MEEYLSLVGCFRGDTLWEQIIYKILENGEEENIMKLLSKGTCTAEQLRDYVEFLIQRGSESYRRGLLPRLIQIQWSKKEAQNGIV